MAPKHKKTSLAVRAKLSFPPSRFVKPERKKNTSKLMRIGTAAAIEFVITQILESSVDKPQGKDEQPILKETATLRPRHIMFAINADMVKPLFAGVVIPGTGAMPNIHSALTKKKKTRSMNRVKQ